MAASTAIPNRPRRAVPRPLVSRPLLTGVLASVLGLGVLGCGSDSSAPPTIAAADAYWSLELNQHAVMLALPPSQYDTVQLTATPKNPQGAPLNLTGTVSYQALDTMVSVTATGLVTARHLTSQPLQVIASLQDPKQGVTHADTVYITVTDAPLSTVDTFSMQPVTGDSAKRALEITGYEQGFDWPVRALDATGAPVPLLVHYHSSKPLTAKIDPLTGHGVGLDTGNVVFTAQSYAYGQMLRDSVQFRIGYMLQNYVILFLVSVLGVLTLGLVGPKKLVLGVGATLMYCNIGQDPFHPSLPKHAQAIDVVFDHPEGVDSASCAFLGNVYVLPTGSGNIAPFGGDTLDRSVDVACRGFRVPGVYHYHSTLFPSDTYEIDIKQDPQ